MGTLHATYPKDTLTRLETMAMMSDVEIPLHAMRAQIGSGVQLIVQVSRLQDGSRKLTHISEVIGFDPVAQAYDVRDLFVREYLPAAPDGALRSRFVPTGVIPSFVRQIHEHGIDLPKELYAAAKA